MIAAYLEKTEGNVEFHEVIDFLRRSYIFHALTVSPVVSTTFVEQFWTSAKSKTINNVRHITAKVAGKVVSISEASIRTDLIFDDADGIDSLTNQAIFNAIQLMGYEGDLSVLTFNKALFSPQWRHLEAKKKFVMYPRFISIFLDRQLANIDVPLDHFPVNSLTSKVFSFMIKKGKHFSGKVTPLFDTMLVQPTQDEGASSERLSDAQPSPSPAPTNEVPNESLPDSTSAQPSEVPFEQQPEPSPSPSHRPSPTPSPIPIIPDSIPEPTEKNPKRKLLKEAKDAQKVYNIDHMKADNAQSEGRTKEMVDEDKELDEDRLSTKDGVSTVKERVSTEENNEGNEEIFESTEQQREGTKEKVKSTAGQIEGTEDQTKEEFATQASQTSTQTPTSMIFGDDETIATLLLNMSKANAYESESEDDDIPQAVEEIQTTEKFLQREKIKQESKTRIKKEDKAEEKHKKEKQGTRKKIEVKEKKNQTRYFARRTHPYNDKENDELRIYMFQSRRTDEFWNSQHEWNIIIWEAAQFSGNNFDDERDVDIHMLIEKKYPLKKEIVVQMIKLKLESEEESTMALELIRFIKKIT
ncbi:hypothetical protein Tco_0188955 [Tanacetum coccineum]